jgi:hypothetical protein
LMADTMVLLMIPAISAAYDAEYRDAMSVRVTVTALWLAVYRQEQGRYPASLQELVPAYLPEVPLDVYDGQPLRYQRRGDGFVLYSIGPDGQDNGGADLSGREGDITIRVPK